MLNYIPSVPIDFPSAGVLLLWAAELAWHEKVGWAIPVGQPIFNTLPPPSPLENYHDHAL